MTISAEIHDKEGNAYVYTYSTEAFFIENTSTHIRYECACDPASDPRDYAETDEKMFFPPLSPEEYEKRLNEV